MITVIIYGLDQFVVGDISKELSTNLAKLYEVEEDEVNFVAPETMIFHKGVEQTSWNVLVHVHAPMKVSVLQDQVATLIMQTLSTVGIHIAVEFYYFSQDNRVQYINEKYPRYMTEENQVDVDQEYSEDMCEGEGEDEIYTGDIFEEAKKHSH